MSRPVDSMTQPRRAEPGALAAAQLKLAACLWSGLPALSGPQALPAWPHPAPEQAGAEPRQHWSARPALRAADGAALLLHHALGQGSVALRAGWAWPALASDPEAVGEAWALVFAASDQWRRWAVQGIDGLAEWLDETRQYRRADSFSKALDQESNLMQQAAALALAQTTAALQLVENIEVSTSWWLTRRVEALADGA